MDSVVDHAVGVILHKKIGDFAAKGEPLCTLLVNDESRLAEATSILRDAYDLVDERPMAGRLIVERIATTRAVTHTL
jgi:thymidine phosphorylase